MQIEMYQAYNRRFYQETPQFMHKTIEFVIWKNDFMARHSVAGVDKDKMAARDIAKIADLLADQLMNEQLAQKGKQSFHDDE